MRVISVSSPDRTREAAAGARNSSERSGWLARLLLIAPDLQDQAHSRLISAITAPQTPRSRPPAAGDKAAQPLPGTRRAALLGTCARARATWRHAPSSVDSVVTEVAKLQQIRQLGLPPDLFAGIAPKLLIAYQQRVAVEPPRELRPHPPVVRSTLLAAFCALRGQEITDSLVELLLHIAHRLGARAEQKVTTELLADLRRVTGKTTLLFQLAETTLAHPEGIVKDVVYPVVSERILQNLVKELGATGPAYRRKLQTVMRSSYRSHYRRIMPALLTTLEFRSNNALHRPVLRALALVKKYLQSGLRYYPVDEQVPLEEVVRSDWQEMVIEEDQYGQQRINRITYEICVLQAVREKLRCKEIWVPGANRYRNPEEDLPVDFEQQRVAYYEALHHPLDADTFTHSVQQAMTHALEALHADLPA